MSEAAGQALEAALALSPGERTAIVAQLLASLEAHDDEPYRAEWAAEAKDRFDAYLRGEMPTLSREEFFQSVPPTLRA